MEVIVANISGTVRKEQFEGRDFVVAPISLIVPGVLNGSKGPVLYPLSEVIKRPGAWNHIPMLLNHPAGTSGRTPEVIENTGVGMLFNSTANGKLSTEGWFDVEKSNKLDSRLIPAILNGQKIEVSTGLELDIDDTAGVENTVSYIGVASNYRPDHVAILLDTQGACGVKDGCGINNKVNKENAMKLSAEDRTAVVADLVTNCDCWGNDDTDFLTNLDERALLQFQTTMDARQKTEKVLVENKSKLASQSLIINAAQEGIKIGDKTFAVNEGGEWKPKEEKKEKKVENTQPVEIKMEDLPEAAQQAIAYGVRAQNARKAELIDLLTSNLGDDEEEMDKQKKRLNTKDVEDLEEDVKLAGKSKNKGTTKNSQTVNSYVAQAGPVNTPFVANAAPTHTPLGLPRMEF